MAKSHLKGFGPFKVKLATNLDSRATVALATTWGYPRALTEQLRVEKRDSGSIMVQEMETRGQISPDDISSLTEALRLCESDGIAQEVERIFEEYKPMREAKTPKPPPSEPKPVTPGKVTDRKHKIFISFSFKDKEEASGIKDRIEKHLGAESCWICTSELEGGYNKDTEIVKAIDKATVLVCLVSQNYTDSPECEKEVQLAREKKEKKKFLPILLESVKWPLIKSNGDASPMMMAFSQLIYIPLHEDGEGGGSEEFERIIKALEEMFA